MSEKEKCCGNCVHRVWDRNDVPTSRVKRIYRCELMIVKDAHLHNRRRSMRKQEACNMYREKTEWNITILG